MKITSKLKLVPGAVYFLSSILIIYLLLLFIRNDLFFLSIKFFLDIILKIIPVFALIFFLMGLTNYFITPKFIINHLKGRGIKKWFFVIVGGILSTGPIYMWYPLLADLKNKGLEYGLIACFLYNRAIKLPLIPIMLLYFSLKYVVVLLIVMVIFSIIQGILLNQVLSNKNEN